MLRGYRRKKKEKKALKLQEAQRAFLASMQVQEGNDEVHPTGSSNSQGIPPRMPLSARLSVSTEQIDEYEDNSGSDNSFDMETLETLSLSSDMHVLPQQYYGNKMMMFNGTGQPLPYSQMFLSKQPAPITTIAHQPFSPASVTNTPGIMHPQRDYSYRRGHSQPAFLSIPTTVAEIPTITHSNNQIQQQIQQKHIQQQPPLMQKAHSNGTLKRIKEHKVIPLSPEKIKLIAAAVSLGLGRGIDATDKMPWVNKKSFQIRRVHGSVIETNEGGILMSYNHEVQSIAETEEKLLSSLNPPELPVSICIEDELDRNVSSTRRIVGRRVVNRSISFQSDFEEKYKDGEIAKSTKESFFIPKDPAEVISNTQNSGHTFEERVCQWILHRLVQVNGIVVHKIDDNPVDQLMAVLMHSKTISKLEDEIKTSCRDLIENLRVTHYVTGVQLGAAEYRIMSDGQYHKKIASEGAFGIDMVATASSKNRMKLTKKEASKCSQLRQIGKIENDHVTKGTQDEVALQIQVQPITRLIKLPVLKSAFKTAIEKYMEGTPSTEGINNYCITKHIIILCYFVVYSGGPFVIKCTGRDLYLTVNKFNNYEVEGTDIPTEASLFYFQTTDDGGNPFEFHIAYYGEDADPNDQTTETSSICRYLEAPLNPQGRCPGPLLMKHSVKVKNTRFTLRSRLSKKSSKSHLEEWIAGEDAFYVACATKKYQHGSYLAVKNVNRNDFIGKHLFMTCCDPSIHNHNGENSFMLFQLTTKETIINKINGRDTPGILPMSKANLEMAKEVETREKKETKSTATALKNVS